MNETMSQGVGAEGEMESANNDMASVVGSQTGEATPLNDVLLIESEFERALIADYKNRERNAENWRIYGGLDYGQFRPDDVAAAAAQGRHLDTINLSRQKVDSLAGAMLRNPSEPDFIPVEGVVSEATKSVKEAWNCDKNLNSWDSIDKDITVDMLVHRAVAEMYISRRWHEDLGNIAIRRLLPYAVVFDPHWQSNNSRDCTKCWKVSYLTPKQIKSLFPELKGRIDREVQLQRTFGEQYDEQYNSVTPNINLEDTTGDRYRVISRYEVVDEEYWAEIDQGTQLELPITDDLAVKIAFLNRTNDAWEADKIIKKKRTRKVCYVTTICPQLSRCFVLEHKKTEVQVGRLPFFPVSAATINGVPSGIIDLIKDINRTLNYRTNLINSILESEANGAQFGDPAIFGNDKKAQDDFVARKNIPNAFFWTAPNALARTDGVKNVRKADIPTDVMNNIMQLWETADRVSKAPAVSDARSDTGESGYLFAQKTRIAEQQQYILFANKKGWLADIAEAYLEQAKIQYSIGMFEREFTVDDGETTVVFNKRVKLPNGQVGIVNDISALPRHRVVITDSPAGLTNRLTTRALDTELLKVLPPENIGTRQVVTTELVETMDHQSKETKAKVRRMRDLEEKQAELTLQANILKLETNNIMAMEQLETLRKQRLVKDMQAQGISPEAILKITGIDTRPQPQIISSDAQASMQPQVQGAIPAPNSMAVAQ